MTREDFFHDWFQEPGAYVLVDGQFGSTGKGLLAGVIAENCAERIDMVTTNAGPNSGHTAYFDHDGWGGIAPERYEHVMTQQLPVASVFANKMGHGRRIKTILNAGAIIDPDTLLNEVAAHAMYLPHVIIHPCAAMITQKHRDEDQATVGRIAGTGKGIGPAIIDKVRRDYGAVAAGEYHPMLPVGFPPHLSFDRMYDWRNDRVFVETAQGFSLGLNSARFYPHVTSRECTVAQALADARIPAGRLRKVVMCLRTYPIRVGNTDTGRSGDGYPDQREITWQDIGVEPEMTTVTKRVRRVFTWSRTQFREAVAANEPNVLFLNFCNYYPDMPVAESGLGSLIDSMREDYVSVMGRPWDKLLLGYGKHSHDIVQY